MQENDQLSQAAGSCDGDGFPFVVAVLAQPVIEEKLKNNVALASDKVRNIKAEVVVDEPDQWLIHVTYTRPKFKILGWGFGRWEVGFWVVGNSRSERHGTAIVTGNSIDPAKDAGAVYSVWEVPDCVYIAPDLTYGQLLNFLGG